MLDSFVAHSFCPFLCPPEQVSRMNLLETESYSDVLDNGRRRKRPKLATGVNDLSALLATAEVWGKYICFLVLNNFVFLLVTLPK